MRELLLLLLWALVILGGATALRCTCRGVSVGVMATDAPIDPPFLDYTSQECEKACCDFPGCVGFQRPSAELSGTLRGNCTLYKSGTSKPTDPENVFVTIDTESSPSTCEVANEMLGKTCANLVTSPIADQTRASCQQACCASVDCTSYSVAIGQAQSLCKLCKETPNAPTESSNDILVEVSKCRQQPESPEPLPCSRGDPSKGLAITSVTMLNSPNGNNPVGFPLAFDGNASTLANVDANEYDSLYVDLGSTKLVGIVSIIAPRKLVTEANLINDNVDDGFILMVGDYPDCHSFNNTPPQCPVCGTVKSVSSNSLYEIDCRGLRGRYVHIFGKNDTFVPRKLQLYEITVHPAPYFPPVPGQYVLRDGKIFGSGSPDHVPASQWEGTTALSSSASTADPYAPWVQAGLGPVALPVGNVEFSFPDTALCTMFKDCNTHFTDGDPIFSGFLIGVGSSDCPINGLCPGILCGNVTQMGYVKPGDALVFTVDCRGAAGTIVWVQLDSRKSFTNTPKLTVLNLKVFAASRIAAGIYPPRTLPNPTLNQKLSATLIAFSNNPDAAYQYQFQRFPAPRPVGLVVIQSTCPVLLIRPYKLSDLDSAVIPASCDPPPEGATYHFSDHYTVVGVGIDNNVPCDSSGCHGIVCDIINQLPGTPEVSVDCRGILAQSVYVMLPQPAMIRARADKNLPRRIVSPIDAKGFTFAAYSMTNKAPQTKSNIGKFSTPASAIATTSEACREACYQNSYCQSWAYSNSVCELSYEDQPFTNYTGPICQYSPVTDNTRKVDFAFSPRWLTFPPIPYSISTESPTTVSPSTESPSTASPSTASPSTASPSTESPSPSTASPSTESPSTASPSTASPSTVSPSTVSPSTASPSTESPSTASPSTASPSTASPSTASPSTESPSTASPSTSSPSTASPSTASPSTASPSTASPSTDSPTTASPTTNSPTTVSPVTVSPTRAPNNPTSAAPSRFCNSLQRCYDCTLAGCSWVQSTAIVGCIPNCAQKPANTQCFGSAARGQCPEVLDSSSFCTGYCGSASRLGCSCAAACGTGCCADVRYSCPP